MVKFLTDKNAIKTYFSGLPDKFETYVAVDVIAQLTVFGNIDAFNKAYPSAFRATFPNLYREYLPIRLAQKTCGLVEVLLDKKHAKNLRDRFGILANAPGGVEVIFEFFNLDYTNRELMRNYLVFRSELVGAPQDTYCNISLGKCKCSLREQLEALPFRPDSIGLGIDPVTNIPRIQSHEIKIDKITSPSAQNNHHLYAMGWSLNGAFSKD